MHSYTLYFLVNVQMYFTACICTICPKYAQRSITSHVDSYAQMIDRDILMLGAFVLIYVRSSVRN